MFRIKNLNLFKKIFRIVNLKLFNKMFRIENLKLFPKMFSIENLKLFLEMSRGKAATDKLFNEINWLIVHSLKVNLYLNDVYHASVLLLSFMFHYAINQLTFIQIPLYCNC